MKALLILTGVSFFIGWFSSVRFETHFEIYPEPETPKPKIPPEVAQAMREGVAE